MISIKRIFVLVIIFLCFNSCAFAKLYGLCAPVDECIRKYGFFKDNSGVIYASIEEFQPSQASLFLAYASDNTMHCRVFDESDGLMLTDELTFGDGTTVSLGKCDGRCCIIANDKCFILKDDKFVLTNSKYTKTVSVMDCKNKKISVTSENADDINSLLNNLKKSMIADYPLKNISDSLGTEKKQKLHDLISACADIMEYDCNNYNYDKLFCNILNTNANYRIITDKSPEVYRSHARAEESIYRVSAEFIDDILINHFGIIPEKPPVNALIYRGFCYSDGAYCYTKKYNIPFSTAVGDFAGIYDLGNNIYYCVFKDVYTEKGLQKPEYSYCMVQDSQKNMRVLKIGMGLPLPSAFEAKKYAMSVDKDKVLTEEHASIDHYLFIFGLILFFVCFISAINFFRKRRY